MKAALGTILTSCWVIVGVLAMAICALIVAAVALALCAWERITRRDNDTGE